MRVLALDLGFRVGFGVLSRGKPPRSGSHAIKGSSFEMGAAFIALDELMDMLVAEHKPDVIAACIPFVGRFPNPVTLRPIFGWECKLQEIANRRGIRYERVHEPDARKAFLGPGLAKGKSEVIKKRVQAACTQLGWVWCDDHAADALCLADFVLNTLDPKGAHRNTPLFISAGLSRARQRKAITA